MRRSIILPALVAALVGGGCYSEMGYGPYSEYGDPDLVDVGPGVQVIADYDYPVFYSNNLYWRYNNGLWYSSANYYGGWSYGIPPVAIYGIRNPGGYAHYRPYGYYARGYNGRGYYNNSRYYGARGAPTYRGAPYRGYNGGAYHGGGYNGGGYRGGGYRGGGYHGGGGGYHGGGGGYHGGGGGHPAGGGGGGHGGGGGGHGGGGGGHR